MSSWFVAGGSMHAEAHASQAEVVLQEIPRASEGQCVSHSFSTSLVVEQHGFEVILIFCACLRT